MYDRSTMETYDRDASAWVAARRADHGDLVTEVLKSAGTDPVVDLGCGPGWHLTGVSAPAVALDASASMLELVPDHAPGALRVRASLDALPFRSGSLGAAVSSRSHVHLRSVDLPAALADLHRSLSPGASAFLHLFARPDDTGPGRDLTADFGTGVEAGIDSPVGSEFVVHGRFPGRRFSVWDRAAITGLIEAAGFSVIPGTGLDRPVNDADNNLVFVLRRERTLPDWVGPGMRLLICGLNPSLHAADAGIGFVSPSNRFWPAAVDAGLIDRRPAPAGAPFVTLHRHRIGMTDLVKRATRRADELTTAEYRDGLERVERLVEWLRPGAVCFVGLGGWRAAVDRRAVAGTLDRRLGGRPVHLMPSTSGLNARVGRAELADHLRTAAELAERSS